MRPADVGVKCAMCKLLRIRCERLEVALQHALSACGDLFVRMRLERLQSGRPAAREHRRGERVSSAVGVGLPYAQEALRPCIPSAQEATGERHFATVVAVRQWRAVCR